MDYKNKKGDKSATDGHDFSEKRGYGPGRDVARDDLGNPTKTEGYTSRYDDGRGDSGGYGDSDDSGGEA